MSNIGNETGKYFIIPINTILKVLANAIRKKKKGFKSVKENKAVLIG